MPSIHNMEMEEDDYGDESADSGSDEGSIMEPLEKETPTVLLKRKTEEDYQGYDNVHKKRKTNECRPPTVQELNRLRETENLFSSNLFRMQIEEMLKETKIKEKHRRLFEEWFNKFKQYLCSLKGSDQKFSQDIWPEELKVSPPIAVKHESNLENFKFVCPEDVTIGGSYSIDASIGPVYSIDLHVHMPHVCFRQKDINNVRFDHKRAYYLAFLANALVDSELIEDVNYVNYTGHPLKPVLELKPAGKLGSKVLVLLWPVAPSSILVTKRLRPGRGNIRSEWFHGSSVTKVENTGNVENPNDPPSPHYNSGLAQDILWKQNQEMLEAELCSPSFREGLILLKIWLRQRRFDKGYGMFTGFIMSMFLVYLIQNKRINKMMSSYQVVRVTWNCLAKSDWTTEGISISSAANGPSLSDFHQHFDVVFVDASGMCNLTAHMRKEIYLQVKNESARAVLCLDASESTSFQSLFMIPVPFEQVSDHLIRFHDALALLKLVEAKCSSQDLMNHSGWILPPLLNTIMSLLQQGLGQRASLILHPHEVRRWPCKDLPLSLTHVPDSLVIGLILNSKYAFDKLERGPSADLPEAQEFRKFWGEVSTLRRFKDGSICETVLWKDKEPICKQLVQHILKYHLGVDQNSFIYIANLVDPLLSLDGVFPKTLPQGDIAVQVVLASFQDLTKKICGLSNVTLSVNSVLGISPLFRYTDVFPPTAMRRMTKKREKHTDSILGPSVLLPSVNGEVWKYVPRYCPPIEAVMSLEHSGKWPKNLEAVKRLKAAFCLQLAKSLFSECDLMSRAHLNYVDVFKDGFVFRIWLVALKEVSLMKQKVGAMGLIGYHDTPESMAFEEKLVLLPKLSSSLHGLQQQFLGFASTVRIAKRWLSSQLLGPPHIPDLVTELLVASLFLSPEPFHPPVESQLGLVSFLRLVSNTDWLNTPVIINLNQELTREKVAELETEFHSSRKSLPALVIYTPYDRRISQFTQTSPSLQILIRLGVLASAALKELHCQCLQSLTPDCMALFRPFLEEYDVLIILKRNWISRIHEKVDKVSDPLSEIRVYVHSADSKIPIVDFDPVQCYLKELREGYGHCALFFHDMYGGEVIGVVWKPSASEEQDFKISNLSGHQPSDKSKVTLNVDAILEDFFIIGSGIVHSIDNRSGKECLSISSPKRTHLMARPT